MAISTGATLATAIANWLDRTDLTARIPEFVALMEAKLYAGERSLDGPGWVRKPLRIRGMIATGTLTPASGSADLTSLTRYIEMERVYWNGAVGKTLDYLAPKDFWSRRAAYESGPPDFYTTEGFTLRIGPKDTTQLSTAYYQTMTSLTPGSTETNWLVTNYPSVYLHGCLAEAYEYEGSDQLAEKHGLKFNALVNGLEAAEEWAAASGGALVMRPPAVV